MRGFGITFPGSGDIRESRRRGNKVAGAFVRCQMSEKPSAASPVVRTVPSFADRDARFATPTESHVKE
jgi:hypothetical protein